LVGIQGRIQTGSYKDKDDKTIYTTDIVADRVEFLEWGDKKEKQEEQAGIPEGFQVLDDDEDIPF
jgi:single-strand DNA-binding protein